MYLSVIIPAYNEEKRLPETLKKVREFLNQQKYEWEVIVVDDGSKDPYPHAIKHGVNMGYGQALMTGIQAATRPIIMTLDGDGQHTITSAKNLYTVWLTRNVRLLAYGIPTRHHFHPIRELDHHAVHAAADQHSA